MTRDEDACLELTTTEMRAMTDAATTRVLDHLAHVNEQPATGDTNIEAFCRSMREPAPPEQASALEPLLDDFFREWMPRSLTTNGPGYLAYIPGGGVFPAAIADWLQNTTNRFTGVRFAAPALVQIEANVLDWFRDWMQFPADTTRGVFTTGGSMANFNAILCAREKHLAPDEIRRGCLYTSTQAHHSVAKSAKLAGIMADRVRSIAVDSAFRMRVDVLEETILQDRAAGLIPFMVVSAAGTTNTGAVDPLDRIADLLGAVSKQLSVWHHVDGAYGAFFHACPELRPLLSGLSRADSVTLDPHKGLFLPYGTGALLVRDGSVLRSVHASTAAYFPDREDDDVYDPSMYGPDLSRGFPGLRVWLTIKLFGAARIRAAIAEKRALALDAATRIRELLSDSIVMSAPPQLSLFAFHLHWPGATRDQENAATRELLDRVAARQRVYLTGCTVQGDDKSSTAARYLARVCVLSFRTRQAQIDACVEDVVAESRAIIARASAST